MLGVATSILLLLARQFDAHPLIMIGELHRWEQLHAWVQELLHDPRFICRADDVVVEFGNSRLQPLADAWSSGAPVAEQELQGMWRETGVPLTWNSPLYRRFYEAIRAINQQHLCEHPVRLVLGDLPLDWAKIHTVKDYQPWTDRDGSIARVIEREVLAKHRRAFVLTGLAHALKANGQDGPATAELIERRHPGAVFSVVPVRTAADAAQLKMGRPPSLELVKGTMREGADFRLIWKSDPEKPWPPMGKVADALLYLGAEQKLLYPPPAIYLDPAYQKELRRRAQIIKDYSGQDFLTTIDGLVKEASGAAPSR